MKRRRDDEQALAWSSLLSDENDPVVERFERSQRDRRSVLHPEPRLEDLLDEALAIVHFAAPDAKLVRIFGAGVDENGRVDLTRDDDFLSRWEFAFYDDGAHRWLTVSWLSHAYVFVDVPDVDNDARHILHTDPLSCTTGALPSSRDIMDVFWNTLVTADVDRERATVTVLHDTDAFADQDGEDVVRIVASDETWQQPLAAFAHQTLFHQS